MQKFVFLLVLSSMVALAAPSAFEEYRSRMLTGQVETIDAPPAVIDAAVEAPPSGRLALLRADPSGHFRADARMNGRPVPVLVDTGATYVALDQTTARQLGIVPGMADYRHRVQTANGETRAALASIARLQLGPIELRDVEALVTQDGTLPVTLLGMSFLSRLSKFEIEDGRLTLSQ
ncbi:TIGR02281 family clan AA aspartic protease [Aurantimonas sp. C2-6-R+9]|uniref:retropepsin-like aspartic protease family protein n=1 Tax=unclassified Aurantimonas TaxID=2638230 RepID=UPI002E17DCD5|nr:MULTISPECIES: TIGR02281 family clan AA aspartic protease [unclassified Aurantimonas]MEC5292398.1 TIGR02281 family clan AA aspartic protease [Aurantimonas sp. C2-3-R2]MEC5382551.1 TIGR02281 family clan AA aspartic protease [Aurantimonas sp. C2-6-R+9]MEC5413457.1 TIGR02281 family clan AA aspartic protease [Aurantimonas sp. C2-4-R8]